ncbi:MAG TPA: aspartate/glutamate racemase family protein [Blastocatellia bacterium]|nr:aspartate/glutamate racemase family protein [Blastocatellia bacterium]
MIPKNRLAIIDWGIGGISIAALIKRHTGSASIYFSDTGVTPYGKMSQNELVPRLNRVIAFLRTLGATHLVVGCNSASTAIPFLKVPDLKLEGIIDSAVRLTERLRPSRLALIGGRRTVLSGAYRRAFARRGIGLTQRIAQPLSALIESGDVSSWELRTECRKIVYPVRKCSHLLLACTHYPAIVPVLRQVVSEETVLIDPAGELVNRIRRWNLPAGGTDLVFTTGDPDSMKSGAWNAFAVRIGKVRKVAI